jgi:predicted dehydrogenase
MHNWGVAGPGGIATRFAEAMRLVDDGEIVGVASRSSERADAFADRFGVRARYGDYRELAADPSVEIVYVATPHVRHAADTIAFLEAGKHVLCEKPLAVNAVEARAMADAARTNGRFLMEAMWSRFLPAYRQVVATLERGTIGEPLAVHADFGFRAPVMPEHRLFDLQLGGGALLDVGIYPVQLCSLVLGMPEDVAARAVIGTTGVDEQVGVILQYPEGRLGIATAAIRVTTSCTARISGSEGWIELPRMMHAPQTITVGSANGEKEVDASFDGDGLRFQIAEVQQCLEQGRLEHPAMTLDESIAIATTLDAVRERIQLKYPAE